MSYVNDLLFLVAIIVPPLLVTLAVFVDLRSRRGFGLVLVALAMLGYCLWRIVPTEQALPFSGRRPRPFRAGDECRLARRRASDERCYTA